MSTDDEVRRIARELHLIREALERMSPPPKQANGDISVQEEPKESAYEKRRIVVLP